MNSKPIPFPKKWLMRWHAIITASITASITIAILAAICLQPVQLWAHDGTLPSPEGINPPPAPILPDPGAQQTIFHIDPTQSKAQYSVQERYVGLVDGKLVVGSSSAIAGDLLIDWDNPQQSQVGMVTVNVEQLTSDSKQRDRQIRKSYLESTRYPEARFIPEADQLFPSDVAPGKPFSFVLHGYLTVHNVTVLSDWQIEVTVERERIVGRATTKILMSDFGVGPISIVGLLSTEDEMTLTLDFVALADGATAQTVERSVADEKPRVTAQEISFSGSIQPILETKCVGCHVSGEIGHSIYPMETVSDVVDYADDLALVVNTGFMPPWSPSHLAPAFKNDRSLSESDKAALLAWVAAGAPTDLPLDTPLTDKSPAGKTMRQDMHLTMPEAYVPTGEMADDYRCFLLDPKLPSGGYVTASEVLPGNRQVVHHVIIFQAAATARTEIETKSAEDDRPGWQCFGGTELSSNGPGAIGDNLGFWVPGSRAWFAGEGLGVYVPPGGLIALQVHYNYAAGFLPDQTSIVLQIESADARLTALRGLPLFAPVEIPCPAGVDNVNCDRATALAEQSAADQAQAAQLFRICDKDVGDYAGQTADQATSSCDWRVPMDGELLQIGGHMHTRGKSLRVELNPDGAQPLILQDLPNWDFNWQGSYQYETPITVKQGDLLRITCVWDNTQATAPEDARYIIWGEGTKDEMCLNILRIKPAPNFETIDGTALMVNMLNIYPNWLPTQARMLLFGLGTLSTGTRIAALLSVLVVGILVVGIAAVYGRRLRGKAKKAH